MDENPGSINPFADSEGGLIEGKEVEFFEWAFARWQEELASMTEDERKAAIASAEALFKRINA